VVSESARHIVREVYSEVLFELAEQMGCVDSVTDDLSCVAEILKAEPEFAAVLTSQTIKPSEKVQIIRRVFGGKVEDLTLDFLSVLARRNRIGFLAGISDKYEMLVDVHHERAFVEITVAKALNDKQTERLKAGLKNAINGEVKVSVEVEPGIIGGIIIKKGDTVIDNSVKTTLQRAVGTVVENLKDRIDEV
jgi:F-type H+-transporting ATPase subunit delta